jgi:hypothetical protein
MTSRPGGHPSNHIRSVLPGLSSIRRVESFLRIAAFVSLGLLARAADAQIQAPGQIRLSLLEAAAGAESRTCTLEVLVNETTGEATLSCERNTPPVSHLAVHRALTASETARLYPRASAPASSRPQASGSPAPARVDGAKVIITIERGDQRVVLDASQGPETLSGDDQQVLRVLREIADELRGAGRR